MRRASAAASLPGATPQRSMPTSISTSAPSSTPKSCATREAASTCSAESKHSAIVASCASAARRRNLRSPTTWLLTRMSFTPPRTSASASPTFCTHWPTAPCAICRSAIAADLCVLACGRTRTPVARENSAIFAMLRSSASRSTTSAGVSMSATEAPISAGGGFIGLPEKFSRVAYSRPAGLVHRARSAAPKASASIVS